MGSFATWNVLAQASELSGPTGSCPLKLRATFGAPGGDLYSSARVFTQPVSILPPLWAQGPVLWVRFGWFFPAIKILKERESHGAGGVTMGALDALVFGRGSDSFAVRSGEGVNGHARATVRAGIAEVNRVYHYATPRKCGRRLPQLPTLGNPT
jgi:hypothetical protein